MSASSKMELFVSLINGFPLLTNATNNILMLGSIDLGYTLGSWIWL